MQLNIDITDWAERYQQEEPNIRTFDDVLALRQKGFKPYSAGIMALVARERGDAEKDILPVNKVLLGVGAAVSVTRQESAMKRKAIMPSGLEVDMRQYIAPTEESYTDSDAQGIGALESVQSIGDTQGTSNALLPTTDPQAVERAAFFLENKVPSYIWGRLIIIAEQGGDYKGEANKLIKRIKEMVKEIGG